MTKLGRRLGLCAFGAVVLVLAYVGWSRTRKPTAPPPPPYAFDMCILHPSNGRPPPITWNDAVLSAVARTLTPDERASLEEALGTAAVRWEAKANPVLEDLEGGDPDSPIIAWFKKGPTFLRTGQASSHVRVCTPDNFCVVPRSKGGPCPADATVPASADEDDRARFIQWPWGHALRFHATSREAAQAAAATLRAQVRNSKAIAVVMTADDADITTKDPFATIRERWTKIAGLKRAAHKERGAVQATPFVVDFGPNDVIVMPRHEAMALKTTDESVAAEVTKAAPQLSY